MPEWFWPSVFTLVISAAYAGYRGMKTDIAKLQADLRVAETKIEPYWARVQRQLAEELHSPHTPEIDMLMGELTAGKITPPRRVRLEELFLAVSHNPKESQARRESAEIMIRIMRKVLIEAAAIK